MAEQGIQSTDPGGISLWRVSQQIATMKQLLAFCAVLAVASTACPRILSREEWGGRPPIEEFLQEVPVPYVVIHHGVSNRCYDQASCSAIVRSYQNYHMDSNGWPDIGYNFLVGEDGNIYKGRGWTRVGAHAPGYNYNSIGLCFIGTFTDSKPNSAAINAARQLIEECGIETGMIRPTYDLLGHRQSASSSTECPGNALYAEIQNWPHWTANP